ncbi:hypothetical protein BHM03_00012133, partial [Ensete ventricosum]
TVARPIYTSTQASATDAKTFLELKHHHSAEEFPTMQGSLQKKTKSRDVVCQSCEQSNEVKGNCRKLSLMETEERKGSRQKKSRDETSRPDRKRHRTQVSREPPTGYIYVRAKRGQATDSHSLAERVILNIPLLSYASNSLSIHNSQVVGAHKSKRSNFEFCVRARVTTLELASGEKGEDKPADEASARYCPWL